MREGLGLPPLERRVGQAAHDFVQAAAGGEVVLSRAEKDLTGSPDRAVALAGPAEGRCWTGAWTTAGKRSRRTGTGGPGRRLSTCRRPAATAEQPKPSPPVAARPRKLSVSDIGLWMTNAYALYARRILMLKPLEPLEGDPEAGGSRHHHPRALEGFVRTHPDGLPEDALEQLRACGRKAFARFNQRPQVQALWWPRFLEAAAWVVAVEKARRDALERVLAEVRGELVIEGLAGPFCLTRARRPAGASRGRRCGDRRLQDRQAARQIRDGTGPGAAAGAGRCHLRSGGL